MSNPAEQHLPGDTVTGTDPLVFSLEFVGRMRKRQGLSHVPSLRTTISIPRFLTARAFRKGNLVPQDYLDAAVLNTPYEDQTAAFEIGREILFPQEANVAPTDAVGAKLEPKAAKPQPAVTDAAKSILDDLAGLNLDFESLGDLSKLDDLLETAEDDQLFRAFDQQQRMLQSNDPNEQAGGRLVDRYGGAGELQSRNIHKPEQIREFNKEMLRGRINSLEADELADGCQSGHGPMLVMEVRHPWEQAGAFAGTKDFSRLQSLLKDVLDTGSAVDIGRTLRFLEPHAGAVTGSEFAAFRNAGIERVRDLSEHAELLDGLRKWITPPDELLKRAAGENPVRALEAARWLLDRFGENLQPRIFDHWADAHSAMPLLSELTQLAVDCERWESMLKDSYKEWVAETDAETKAARKAKDPNADAQFHHQFLETAEQLKSTKLPAGEKLAAKAVLNALERVKVAEQFLPLLDSFLERNLYPDDVKGVVKAAKKLGIDERLVYERLGQPLEQLAQLIRDGLTDPERYKRLIDKIKMIPPELLKELCEKSFGDQNLSAMATLLAIDLGNASGLVPEQFAADACGFKGIGGGMNLLKQWFDGRAKLTDRLRAHIKELARNALTELAFEWIAGGSGSSEGGLTPQNRSRPYRAGDELDQLDLEATLDTIISQGKQLDQITEDDLFVPVQSKGQAALCVLLDISGSMGGRELANCAISVVMLLGRLSPQEIAIALFESDTHVVKGFQQEREIDEVIDRLLELAATGGTRVDQALRWASEQFDEVPEAEFRVLFLLSDFEFFESPRDLLELTNSLSGQNVNFLGAAHGRYSKRIAEFFQEALGGQIIKLRNLDAVPGLLLDAIRTAG